MLLFKELTTYIYLIKKINTFTGQLQSSQSKVG